jgi:hypothetical protein
VEAVCREPVSAANSLLASEKQAISGREFDFDRSFQALRPEPPYIGTGTFDSGAAIFRSEAGNSMRRAGGVGERNLGVEPQHDGCQRTGGNKYAEPLIQHGRHQRPTRRKA